MKPSRKQFMTGAAIAGMAVLAGIAAPLTASAQSSENPAAHSSHSGHREMVRDLPYSTNKDGSEAHGQVRVTYDASSDNIPTYVHKVEYKFDQFVAGKSPDRALVYWWEYGDTHIDFEPGKFKFGTQNPIRDGKWHVLSTGGYAPQKTSVKNGKRIGAAEIAAINGDEAIRMFG